MWIPALLFEPIGCAFGYLIATGARLPHESRRTVSLETGVQNYVSPLCIGRPSRTANAPASCTLHALCFPVDTASCVHRPGILSHTTFFCRFFLGYSTQPSAYSQIPPVPGLCHCGDCHDIPRRLQHTKGRAHLPVHCYRSATQCAVYYPCATRRGQCSMVLRRCHLDLHVKYQPCACCDLRPALSVLLTRLPCAFCPTRLALQPATCSIVFGSLLCTGGVSHPTTQKRRSATQRRTLPTQMTCAQRRFSPGATRHPTAHQV